jgi:hypothetical protein
MKVVQLVACAGFVLCAALMGAAQTKIDFNKEKAGALPSSFTAALTGNGQPGVWVVLKDVAAPAQGQVLAQTAADTTNYRFPLCVYEKLTTKNADISVKFKTISGEKDQVGGLIWRYRDKDNYYLVRANAREHNLVLYKMQQGKREALSLKGESPTYGRKTSVPTGQWHTLRVVVSGILFTVYLNGAKMFDVEDATFTEAGKIGVWTKADSVTYYDDLVVKAK